MASHWGGTRNATVVHWPAGISQAGQVRHQFHHVIDIAPTILDVAGLPHPAAVHGVAQDPLHGVSMRYSFDEQHAEDGAREVPGGAVALPLGRLGEGGHHHVLKGALGHELA